MSRVPIHIHELDLGPDEIRTPTQGWREQAGLMKTPVPPEFSPFPHTETELTEPPDQARDQKRPRFRSPYTTPQLVQQRPTSLTKVELKQPNISDYVLSNRSRAWKKARKIPFEMRGPMITKKSYSHPANYTLCGEFNVPLPLPRIDRKSGRGLTRMHHVISLLALIESLKLLRTHTVGRP
jgi:hypothetical protein